jgi:hypothetical protein
VPATGTHRKEAKTVEFETKQGPPSIRDMKVRAALNEPAAAKVEEIMSDPDGSVHPTNSEVVVFVNETGHFWANLDRMYQCTAEALARVK